MIAEQVATVTPLFTMSILQDFMRFYHETSDSQYLEQAMHIFQQQKDFPQQ